MSGMEPLLLMQLAAAGAQTGISLMGQKQANATQDAVTDYNVRGLQIKAGQERAASEVRAGYEKDKTDRLMAVQRARLAASGGGMGGSGAAIIGDTAARGSYNQDMQLWEGNERAIGFENQARMTRFAADEAKKGRGLEMASTILKGVSTAAPIAAKAMPSGRQYYYGSDAETEADRWKRGTTVSYG